MLFRAIFNFNLRFNKLCVLFSKPLVSTLQAKVCETSFQKYLKTSEKVHENMQHETLCLERKKIKLR